MLKPYLYSDNQKQQQRKHLPQQSEAVTFCTIQSEKQFINVVMIKTHTQKRKYKCPKTGISEVTKDTDTTEMFRDPWMLRWEMGESIQVRFNHPDLWT